jgi:cytochrome c-type biogenesis protein CcsB
VAGTLDQPLLVASLALYLAAAVAYGLLWWRRAARLRVAGLVVMALAVALNTTLLVGRWIEAGRPPFKTLYESLVLLAGCIALVYLFVEVAYRMRILGLPAALASAAALLYAVVRMDREIATLPAALQSGWFIPHVVVYFFGYASLVVAAGAAMVHLLHPGPIAHEREHLLGSSSVDLSSWMHGAVRFGFVLLTIGLFIGGVWAKDAWGDYWTWDPKETWALVSWLVYATYLHLHHVAGWRSRRLAIVVVVGMAAVLFTYIGVNFLPTTSGSLHAYQ